MATTLDNFSSLQSTLWKNINPIYIPLTLLSLFTLYALYNYFLHPLAFLPGPFSAKIGLDSWIMTRTMKRDAQWKLREIHEKYGPMVRIARNQCDITDPEAINTIYKSGWNKTNFYYWFHFDFRPTIMSTKDHQKHLDIKKGMNPAFSTATYTKLEEFIDTYSLQFCAVLEEYAQSKKSIDLGKWFQWYAFDVVGDVAFGQSFNFIKTRQDPENLAANTEKHNSIVCRYGQGGWLGPIFDRIDTWLGGGEGPRKLGMFTQKCVDARMISPGRDKSERSDMLGKLIRAKGMQGDVYSRVEVLDAAGQIVAAGSDTTAMSFRNFFYFVVKDSRIYTKLQAEIDQAYEQGQLKLPVPYSQAVKLEYLQACIKESLRLHPALGWFFPRTVPKEGVEIGGKWFKGGTELSMTPSVVHWTEEAYGKDAKEFRPERWIECSEDERRILERNLISFGSGSRMCIGKQLSFLEMSKLLPQLFLKFNFNFTPRSANSPHRMVGIDWKTGKVDMNEPWNVTSQWFNLQYDFWFDVTMRAEVD